MKFNVPQFIEEDDKILGPFSLKQSLFMALGGGILFALWFMVEIWAFIIIAIPVIVVDLLFVFYKVNGMPLTYFLGSVFTFLIKPRLYIWKKDK